MAETDEAFESWMKALGNQYAKGVLDERRRIVDWLCSLHFDKKEEKTIQFIVDELERGR